MVAATLSPSFGIYSGYEACENVPVQEGSEEYLGSEKYELKERRLQGDRCFRSSGGSTRCAARTRR